MHLLSVSKGLRSRRDVNFPSLRTCSGRRWVVRRGGRSQAAFGRMLMVALPACPPQGFLLGVFVGFCVGFGVMRVLDRSVDIVAADLGISISELVVRVADASDRSRAFYVGLREAALGICGHEGYRDNFIWRRAVRLGVVVEHLDERR